MMLEIAFLRMLGFTDPRTAGISAALHSISGMYAHYFTYVCEDCGVRETCGRGEIPAIRKFYAAHPGHNTHNNDFTQTGPTLTEFLKEIDDEYRRHNRIQKLVKILTFGKRGGKMWPVGGGQVDD